MASVPEHLETVLVRYGTTAAAEATRLERRPAPTQEEQNRIRLLRSGIPPLIAKANRSLTDIQLRGAGLTDSARQRVMEGIAEYVSDIEGALGVPQRTTPMPQATGGYEALGDAPHPIDIATNDRAHGDAHTLRDHGPALPYRHAAGTKTVEGRLLLTHDGWPDRRNQSYQWTSIGVINATVNEAVRARWEEIRSALAVSGRFEATYDSGGEVGRGFINAHALGFGPAPQPEPHATSWVTLTLIHIPGPPAGFYVVRSFPTGVPGGLGG
jgi:hypothetical protein